MTLFVETKLFSILGKLKVPAGFNNYHIYFSFKKSLIFFFV